MMSSHYTQVAQPDAIGFPQACTSYRGKHQDKPAKVLAILADGVVRNFHSVVQGARGGEPAGCSAGAGFCPLRAGSLS